TTSCCPPGGLSPRARFPRSSRRSRMAGRACRSGTRVPTPSTSSSRRGDLRNLRHDSQDVVQLHAISGFEMARRRFRNHTREAHLTIRIVGICEVDVERNLAVNTDRLNFLDDAGARALQHGESIALGPPPSDLGYT